MAPGWVASGGSAMVVQREVSLGSADLRPRHVAAFDHAVECWDTAARLDVPDLPLAHAVELAREAVRGRASLSPGGTLPGAARLARRLAGGDPDDDRLPKLLGVLRSRLRDGLVMDERGRPDAAATAVLGRCEAVQHDPRAWDRVQTLAAVVRAADEARPDQDAAAGLLEVLTGVLAGVRPGVLEALAVLPDEWFGEDVRVDGLPIPGAGRLSWRVTWPDDWPELTWATSVPGRRMTSPGLAPGWSDPRPRGTVHLDPSAAPSVAPEG